MSEEEAGRVPIPEFKRFSKFIRQKADDLLDAGHMPESGMLADSALPHVPHGLMAQGARVYAVAICGAALQKRGYKPSGMRGEAWVEFEQLALPGFLTWLRGNIKRRGDDSESERADVERYLAANPQYGLTVEDAYALALGGDDLGGEGVAA